MPPVKKASGTKGPPQTVRKESMLVEGMERISYILCEVTHRWPGLEVEGARVLGSRDCLPHSVHNNTPLLSGCPSEGSQTTLKHCHFHNSCIFILFFLIDLFFLKLTKDFKCARSSNHTSRFYNLHSTYFEYEFDCRTTEQTNSQIASRCSELLGIFGLCSLSFIFSSRLATCQLYFCSPFLTRIYLLEFIFLCLTSSWWLINKFKLYYNVNNVSSLIFTIFRPSATTTDAPLLLLYT